jgi:stage V sporulation protein B
VVGPFSGGTSSSLELSTLARAGAGIFLYTLLFNVFLFFDSQMLRPLVGYFVDASTPNIGQLQARLSGLYGAVQNIGFVPYQLVIAVTFVVFPLVSKATFDNDQERARGYVETALRYSLLLLGILVAAIVSAPRALLTLPHGAEYGGVGLSLQCFALGQLCFGVLAVCNTILIGAGHTRRAAEAVVLGLIGFGLAALCLLPTSMRTGREEEILMQLAICSATGFAVALLRALWSLQSLFGASLRRRSLFVVCVGVLLVFGVSLFFPEGPATTVAMLVRMLLRGGVGVLLFVGVLLLGRELTPEDVRRGLLLFQKKRSGEPPV